MQIVQIIQILRRHYSTILAVVLLYSTMAINLLKARVHVSLSRTLRQLPDSQNFQFMSSDHNVKSPIQMH